MCVFCVELCLSAVKIRLSGGSRAPAFVNPEPLLGVGANHALDGRGEIRGVYLDIAFVVAGAN